MSGFSGFAAAAALPVAVLAATPAIADGATWLWQGHSGGIMVTGENAPAADNTRDSGSGGLAYVTAEQTFYGDVSASMAASVGLPSSQSAGAGQPGIAGTAVAVANHMAIETGTSTFLDVAQRHVGAHSGAPSVIATASVTGGRPGEQPEPGGASVQLDVLAVQNYLSVNLASDDPDYVFMSVIEQDSSGGVTARATADDDFAGAAPAGQTAQVDTFAGGTSTGSGQSRGVSATAIGNFTSLRFGSPDGGGDQ